MKKKCYVLDMFPYPSGDGLHVGHPKGYIATDIYSRMKKMQGYEVIHPMGWDAFGLPAEQYAIKNKMHPSIAVKKNIKNFKSQLNKINFDYDWDREISTTDPKFYKWTQWIFKQLYKKGLAYESFEPINWCPSCKTGLANEDLEGNACERCSTVVEKKPLRQWNLKITEYADRLIDDLNTLIDWPEHVKTAQRNWIGRSEGSEIEFEAKVGQTAYLRDQELEKPSFEGLPISIGLGQLSFKIFTTRADTLFGCTYTVLAPEHELVKELLEDENGQNILKNKEEVKKYLEEVKSKTDIERSAEGREKTGVKLEGVVAINPSNQKEVPIYIADYVLASYGTGAIMAVPAHDERDYEFANKYGIQILDVVGPVFEDKTETSKWVEGKDCKKRNLVMGIIKDVSTNTYCILDWKLNGWRTFVSGMIEEGETQEEALIREIKEEAGLSNIKIVKKLGFNFSKYFIPHKNFNNDTTNFIYYCEAINNKHAELSEDESKKHTVKWLNKNELLNFFVESENFQDISYLKYGLSRLDNILFTGDGRLLNSAEFDGMSSAEARIKITEKVGGKIVKKYKLREWVFARQRYWGESFPIVYATDEHGNRDQSMVPIVVADSELPVLLPQVESYEPTGTGESPLANIKSFTDVYGYINSDGEFESVQNKYKNTISVGKVLPDAKKVEGSTVIAYDKNKNLFLKLNNLNTNETWLPSGGINYGESFEGCAMRELKEEAGISKIEKIIELGAPIKSYYYNANKNSNRESLGYNYLAYVDSEQEIKFAHEEHEKFEVGWVSYEDLYKSISGTAGGVEHWVEALERAKFCIDKNVNLFKRETNTMPQWAGSSWYWLRFLDPHNDNFLIDKEIEKKWPQVDVYVGGDHATRHLIYARFWHKFLYDIGVVSHIEPFKRLEFLGFILAPDGSKMSKSKGNTINPDDIVAEYGADTFRIYEMFMAPFEATAVWNTSSIRGVKKFLERVEKMHNNFNTKQENKVVKSDNRADNKSDNVVLNQTIKKVGEDIESFKFNTAVSQMMICLNYFEDIIAKGEIITKDDYDKFMIILAPFAPTLCSEYLKQDWPEYNENKLQSSSVRIALQINGKMRGTFEMPIDTNEDDIKSIIKENEIYKKYVIDSGGRIVEPKKIIIVKNKIVNIVL